MFSRNGQTGFTLMEMLIAVALAALLLTGISAVVNSALGTEEIVGEQNRLLRETRFALNRMTLTVAQSPLLVLPLTDKPDTNWRENLREETIPPSPPEGDSTKATAVLAICLGGATDLDADGYPDSDNDRDGRIDEDFPADIAFDYDPGIHLIDDGGDGLVDDGFFNDADDDERFSSSDEDPINGVDDDGDGVIDEDPGADMNGDGAPGTAGVDDDEDGQIDEGSSSDDDEDGSSDEDWMDVVVYYLQGDSLIERHPVPWDETANGSVTGRDFVESEIATGVTRFRVERPIPASDDHQFVDLTLELTDPISDTVVSLSTRVRLGSAL